MDQDVLKNYRPVSNLSYLSKIIEKVVSARITDHMNSHKLYQPLQSAYRQLHGTETALIKVHNDILRSLDNKHAVLLVLLDLSAAFDTIDHTILISRMQSALGIHGAALSWIQSYLSDRTQAVMIDGHVSVSDNLTYGVPQGSVLGPKLFIVYSGPIADIAQKHNIQVHMYADDTQLYLSYNLAAPGDEVVAVHRLQTCISDIKQWMSVNKLMLNDDKSEFLVIASNHQRHKVSVTELKIGDSSVSATSSARNLGVIFDQALNMNEHITRVCQVSFLHLRHIYSIRKLLSRADTEHLIHAFVTSRLDNGNSMMYGASASSLGKLQRVQNASARCISRARKYDHISPILSDLHWLPIRERITFKILLLTWRALNSQAPPYLTEMLIPRTALRALRSDDSSPLVVPRTFLHTYGDRAFSVVAPRLWNGLPNRVKDSSSKDMFKCRLKTHLMRS